MKVLVISHHREDSGWGRSCRDFLKALNTQVDVVAKPITFQPSKVDDEIEKMERNTLSKVTHVVQYVLPKYISYYNGFEKVVGISLFETQNLNNKIYNQLSLVDTFWNFGTQDINITNGIDVYQAFQPKLDFESINIPEANGTYKFYVIGECIKRKNIHNIIKAYYGAFSIEPVSLIIKSGIPGTNPADSKKYIESIIDQVKRSCKLYHNLNDYPPIYIITDRLSDRQIRGLHNYGDCYINASYGESICYPMLEAASFNKSIISTQNKYSELLANTCLVQGMQERCYGQLNTFPEYNTFKEIWSSPINFYIEQHMKSCFKNKVPVNYPNLLNLSYEKTGEEYLSLLLS